MAVTLANIIASARLETNTVGSGFFDDTTEMPFYVNTAVAAVWDRLIGAFQQYAAVVKAFSLTSTNVIALTAITGADPSEQFYKELGVDFLIGGVGGRKVSVPNIGSFMNRNDGSLTAGPYYDGLTRAYYISGSNLIIYPESTNFAGAYQLIYVPNAPTLTSGVNLPVELERWQRLIVLETALLMRSKREQDTSALETKIAIVNKQMDDAAQNRSKEGKFIPHRRLSNSGRGGGYYGL